MNDLEEELANMTLEDEIMYYLINKREDDLNKLTPKSRFKINIQEHPALEDFLKDKRIEFRTALRKTIIKAFSTYKIEEGRADLINKIKDVFADIQLEVRIPKTVNIEDVKAEKHEGKIITFPCEILQVEEPKTVTTSFLFKCVSCPNEELFPPNTGAHICSSCGEAMTNEGVAESETVRTITVQNINSADNNPVMFVCDFHRELTSNVVMNQKILLTGIFKSVPARGRHQNKNEILIDVINTSTVEEERTEKPDPLTLQMYKDLAKNGKLIDKLIRSYAWHIEGDNPLKLACLLFLAGGVEQDNHRARIHIFFLGDPSTAKSEIAKWIVRITQNSAIVDGTASSGVGLGAGMITLPNGRTGMVAGPLVKHNGGHVFIDEIDKMDKEKYEMLLGIMEDGRCRRTLAGTDIDLPAYTSIIVCANPINSLWDLENPSVGANINLKAYLLSRADLMFRVLQRPNEEKDRQIGMHIIKSRNEKPKDIFSEEELTMFFNYVRELKPTLPEESEKKILDFFVKREKFQLGRDSVPMDWRQYEGMVRISFAFAKILLKPYVDEECVERTIKIFRESVESFGIALEDGGNIAESSPWFVSPKDKADLALTKIIKRLEEEKGKAFRDEILLEMGKAPQWKSEDHAQSVLNTWHIKGRFIEKPDGSIKLVD